MTSPSACTFVEATSDLARAYYGGPPPYSFKGHVALLDDQPVGIGGVYYVDRLPVAFSEEKGVMSRKDKARAARLLETMIRGYRVPVFAIATEPTSVGLLTKFGFEMTPLVASLGPVMKRVPPDV